MSKRIVCNGGDDLKRQKADFNSQHGSIERKTKDLPYVKFSFHILNL